ncbi:hypothetical protein BC835DRAFT_92717 [Cytidiella melzeri]|nr:hypothetical protein BC835DRAFT_92717 [Cytidiella melzeri]
MSSMGPPRPPVSSTTVTSSPARVAHSLALLTEYTHSLDSLPLDLSRNFADLRELDAVLSSSMTAVTSKVIQLTNMIENHPSREERLHLLADIADEVSKLKPGADDKIRVACHAADALRGHQSHMTNLLDHIPEPEYSVMAGMLSRKTVYPHVAARSYVPAGMAEGGRRQRRTALLASGSAMESTPNKRRRVVADDGETIKSPSKPRTGEASRARNGARKKTDRAASPTESIVSAASHLPASALPPQMSRQNTGNRAGSSASSVKRVRGQAAPAQADDARQEFNHPPSSSHPSLPIPYANGSASDTAAGRNGITEWATGQLEGPGMPVARSFPNPTPSVVAEVDTDGGAAGADADGDGDDGRTYCFCDRVSFGEMIACDDGNCEREWFHLACIGLTVAPEGSWICETCRAKRATKRSGRGGKRRAGGGRAGARNTSA